MFRTRRYSKKTTTKPRSKDVPRNKQLNHSAIGTNDLLYHDISFTDSYNWHLVPPLGAYSTDEIKAKSGKLKSLKLICASHLARNAEHLESRYLEYAPWECWHLVWDKILSFNNDSFRIYALFAAKFGEMEGFKAHKLFRNNDVRRLPDMVSLKNERSAAVEQTRLPSCPTYRVENIFLNVRMTKVISTVNNLSFSPLTILDLSEAQLSPEDLYQVFNLRNLVALNLSNNRLIGDRFTQSMITAIAQDGKLNRLLTVRVCDTSVTPAGALYILTSGYLSHFECDHSLPKDKIKVYGQKYVSGTKWFELDSSIPQLELASRLPMGLKLHTLFRYFSRSKEAQNLDTTLDIKFHSAVFSTSLPLETRVDVLRTLWKTRLFARLKPAPHSYFHNTKHQLPGQDPTTKEKPQRRSKKLKIKADASSYFS